MDEACLVGDFVCGSIVQISIKLSHMRKFEDQFFCMHIFLSLDSSLKFRILLLNRFVQEFNFSCTFKNGTNCLRRVFIMCNQLFASRLLCSYVLQLFAACHNCLDCISLRVFTNHAFSPVVMVLHGAVTKDKYKYKNTHMLKLMHC